MLGRGRGRGRDLGRDGGGLISKGVKALAGGVGLASESIKTYKENKAQEKANAGNNSQLMQGSAGDETGQDALTASSSKDPPPSYSSVPGVQTSAQSASTTSNMAAFPKDDSIEKVNSDLSNANLEDEVVDNLEEEWELDEAQDDVLGSASEKEQPPQSGNLEDTFIRDHPPPKYEEVIGTGRLELPVVLPQRRPQTRSRGFVRAYAPLLENCGIDQAAWLSFLDTFRKSSMASPWINAINLAAFATIAIPSGIGLAVSYAIQQATKVAIEMQGRERTNRFLHKINEEFFRPRGLYCLVMTFKPNSRDMVQEININATIASNSAPKSGFSNLQNKFKASDATTYAEWQFPETAPLVFPALDQLAHQTGGDSSKKQSALATKHAFVADYFDKRATAEYARKNPNSTLANVPAQEFKSRYADPNHPAASGSLISFVSGGHLVPAPESRGLIGGLVSVASQKARGVPQGTGKGPEYYQREYGRRPNDYYDRSYQGRGRRNKSSKGPIGMVNKLLKENVLYMMVVNMPTEEEMAAASAANAK